MLYVSGDGEVFFYVLAAIGADGVGELRVGEKVVDLSGAVFDRSQML